MTGLTRRWLAAAAPALASAGCTPLALFDLVAPRDSGSRKVASGLPYGSHPRQALDIWAPSVERGGSAPLLVFFYGGSWKEGTKEEYAFAGAAFAAQGFVTVVPDYRVYPEVRFPDFLDDGAAAIRFAIAEAGRFGASTTSLVLAGHSAGAYNAAMLALDRRFLERAGVPPGRVRAFAGLSGPYDFLPLDPGTAQEVFGLARDKPATQPIRYAGKGSPAAYLATGEDDTIVRPRNTIRLAARLRAAGIPVLERLYPGLDHKDTLLALSVPFRGRAPILAEASGFLKAQLGAG